MIQEVGVQPILFIIYLLFIKYTLPLCWSETLDLELEFISNEKNGNCIIDIED